MSYIILAINPGSTSTKIAVYEDTQPVLSLAINHSAAEIAAFATIGDQFEWRKDLVLESLRKRGFDIGTLSAVIGRGGLVHPVEGGVYEVNDALHDDLLHARRQHASNLGGLIAQEIAAEVGVKAYIADPVVVDEMIPYARISGLPQLPRESVFHALNQKAIARRYARETGRKYEELNLIVSHMGAFQWERLLPLACYVDLSAILPDYVRRYGVEGTNALLRKFGPRRLLFATDFPASRSLRPEEIYTVYCGILDQMDFTPEEAAEIAYENAVALLG